MHPEALSGALAAVDRGESIVPTRANKKPLSAWKRAQSERANAQQIREWAETPGVSGFAVITGALSNLVVLDFDGERGNRLLDQLSLEPHVQTGSGGHHLRVEHPGHRVATQSGRVTKLLEQRYPGLDIRGDGGLAIQWGSSSSGPYETLRNLAELEPIENMPEGLALDLGLIAGKKMIKARIPEGRRHAELFTIAAAMRGRGEDAKAILAELERVNRRRCDPPLDDHELRVLAEDVAQRYEPDGPDDPLREVEDIIAVRSVGLSVVRTRIVGRGSNASADIYLSDGNAITFESLRDMATAQRLAIEIVTSTGAVPAIKTVDAHRLVALMHQTAEKHDVFTEDERALDWGESYLQSARTIEVDMADQASRWRAFSALAQVPREDVTTATSTVLLGTDDRRYVRRGWFFAHCRELEGGAPIPYQTIAHQMERVGWQVTGKHGRIKATCPSRSEALVWAFFVVPPGWGGRKQVNG